MSVWLNTQDAADLMDCHLKTVAYRVKNQTLVARQIPSRGKSGFKYEIALDSLPKEAQRSGTGKMCA